MKITIYGSGYVGLVTGACLAEMGNYVLCVDVNEAKIKKLKKGEIPIYEPGLESMIQKALKQRLIDFTSDMKQAANHAEIQFIAVGTPADEDGSADLQYVLAVAESIGSHMTDRKIIVDKSTVPVGTGDKVQATVEKKLKDRGKKLEVHVVSNPEFLKEGTAISDFMKPARIILGTDSTYVQSVMRELYAAFCRTHERLIVMDIRSAELTKYAANAMLATKISFINEISQLAEGLGADIEKVRFGIGSDPRIGYQFMYPGCGYGGSCFPKDIKALERSAREIGFDAIVLSAVEQRNRLQKGTLFNKLSQYFSAKLSGKTIAIWGLAFKPNTDDMRDAPSRTLMESLWKTGARVQVYDPQAMEETKRIYGEGKNLTFCNSTIETLEGADALCICTEWRIFRSPDFDLIKEKLKSPVIIDGRNLYDPERMAQRGFDTLVSDKARP